MKTRPAGQLEQRLLVLVTLGLVAFGLVMVFSATSASAALGAGDPMTFLVKQGAYALAGLLLLALASRFDYHRLRTLAPMLLVGSLFLCIAVLVGRAADQRRPALVPRRADQRAALRAGQDRRVRLDLRAPRPATDAAERWAS